MGDFDLALEAYVTLAATYPKSPLVASVMIRVGDHFYKKEQFDVAAQIGEKFVEKFEGHQHASRMAFRVGQCRYKAGKFTEAGKAFDRFARVFAEDKLCCRRPVLGRRELPHGAEQPFGLPALQPLPLGLPLQRSRQVRPRPPGPARNAQPVRSRQQERAGTGQQLACRALFSRRLGHVVLWQRTCASCTIRARANPGLHRCVLATPDVRNST